HRIALGEEEYLSISASADGRRLAAAVGNPTRVLLSFPISDRVAREADLSPVKLSSTHASAPRIGPDYMLYRSSRGGPNGLWKRWNESETELWKGSDGALSTAAAISSDGKQIAFVVRRKGRGVLHVMAADGTNPHPVAETMDVRDAPSWS